MTRPAPATLDTAAAATLLGVRPDSVRRVLLRHGVTGRADDQGVTRYPAADVHAAIAARPGPGNRTSGPDRIGGITPPSSWTARHPATTGERPTPLPKPRGLPRIVFDHLADGTVTPARAERHRWHVPCQDSTPAHLSAAVDRLVEQGLAQVFGRGATARVLLTWDGERLACHHERKARAAGTPPARGDVDEAVRLVEQACTRLDSASADPSLGTTGHGPGGEALRVLSADPGAVLRPRLWAVAADLRVHLPGEPLPEAAASALEQVRLELRTCERQTPSSSAGRSVRWALAEVGNELRRAHRLVLDLS